jgi:hypothetical protein
LGYILNTPDAFDIFRRRLEGVFGDSQLWITLYRFAVAAYDAGSQPAQKTYFSRIRDLTDGHPLQKDLQESLDAATFMADETFQDLPPQKVLEHIDHLFASLEREEYIRRRERLARELRQAEAAGDAQVVRQLLEQLKQ